MDGSAICSTKLCDGGADGILFVADGAGVANATDLLLSGDDFGGGVCMVVSLPGSLCGLYGAREPSEPHARGSVADNVRSDGFDCTTGDVEAGGEYGHASAGRGVFGTRSGEYVGILDARSVVYVGDFDLGIKLCLDILTADGSGAKTG